MDLPPPCTRFECAGLNKLFKTLQISVDSALYDAEHIADVLHNTFGVVIQFQRNASSVLAERTAALRAAAAFERMVRLSVPDPLRLGERRGPAAGSG